jgi:uncharacterized membrane protein
MADADFDEMIAASRREREGWALTRIHLAVPFLAVGTAVVLLWADERLARTGAAAAAALFYLGKLVILTGAAPRSTFQMASLELAALVFFMDLVVAYLFAFNLHYIYRVPRVGPWLERLQAYCRFWLATHRWMRKWAFTAVMLFVMFPLTGTGAPAGTLLGRIVGLKPWTTLSAIALGSALGCTMMAAFAKPLEPVFHDIQEEVWFKALGLVVLGALLLALIALGRRLSRAAENHARETKAA